MISRKLFLPIFCAFVCCGTVDVNAALPRTCDNCAPGKYCVDDNRCEDCPAGMYCTDGHAHLCEPEHYQDQTGQTSCKRCPSGQYPFPNHVICDPCNTGNFAVMEYNDETVCYTCSGGTPYANAAHDQCVACNGYAEYVVDNKVCRTCSGTTPYVNDSYDDCVACDAGNYVPDENGVCRQCSDEKPYANQDHTQCVTCDAGDVVGGVCYPNCATGQYVNNNGLCSKCPSGYYVNDEKKCIICESGYYCRGDGSMIPCSEDTFSAAGQRECSKCPDGYIKIKGEGTDHNTTYVAGESLDSLCKKIEIKIKIGSTATEIPKCLKPGKINSRVVRQR